VNITTGYFLKMIQWLWFMQINRT